MINRRDALEKLLFTGAMVTINPSIFSPQQNDTLVIGSEAGADNTIFSDIGHAAFDGEGNIHVLDRRECVIRKFTSEGSFLMQYGGRGGAPFEFSRPYLLRIRGDRVVVADGARYTLSEFDLNGAFRSFRRISDIATFVRDFQLLDEDLVLIHGYIWSDIQLIEDFRIFQVLSMERGVIDRFGNHHHPSGLDEFIDMFDMRTAVRIVLGGKCVISDDGIHFIHTRIPSCLIRYDFNRDEPIILADDESVPNEVRFLRLNDDSRGIVGDVGLKGRDDELYSLSPRFQISGSLAHHNGITYSLVHDRENTKHYVRAMSHDGVVDTRYHGTSGVNEEFNQYSYGIFMSDLNKELVGLFARDFPFPAVTVRNVKNLPKY